MLKYGAGSQVRRADLCNFLFCLLIRSPTLADLSPELQAAPLVKLDLGTTQIKKKNTAADEINCIISQNLEDLVLWIKTLK